MTIFAWCARITLAAVFAAAAMTKWSDRDGTYRAARDFGAPPRVAAPVALVLAPLEGLLAIALIPTASARPAAFVAVLVLIAFSAAILRAVLTGGQVACSCFGSASARPVGPGTLVRNVALLTAALSVVVVDQPTAGEALAAMRPGRGALTGAVVVLAIIAVVEGWWLLVVLRRHGDALRRLAALEEGAGPPAGTDAGLPLGTTAPAFQLVATTGETVASAELLVEEPLLLVFSSPQCPACTALLPVIVEGARRTGLRLAVLATGSAAANRQEAEHAGIERILLDRRGSVATAYGVTGTPAAVLVGHDGVTMSPLALGAAAVRALVEEPGDGGPENRPVPPRVGAQAPRFVLRDLDGAAVTIGGPSGAEVLLLFFDPECGFCQRMVPDLRSRARTPVAGAPDLVVIARGGPDAMRLLGLEARVLLDPLGTAMTGFGMPGTPSGVLIDVDGRVASDPAAGAAACMALLDAPRARAGTEVLR